MSSSTGAAPWRENLTWEIATGKPSYPARLTKASACLRNDQPAGFGVILDVLDAEAEHALFLAFEGYRKGWDTHPKQHEAILSSYEAQVEDFARRPLAEKQGADPGLGSIIVLNMVWLVWAGRIPNDNFNGTQFIWEAVR